MTDLTTAALAAARTRYLDADRELGFATKHLGQLYRDTDTAKGIDNAKAQATAKAADAAYGMDVWYPAYRESKDAAKHLAETLGLDAARLGSALR